MERTTVYRKVVTLVSNQWWDSVQEDISDAIMDIDKTRQAVKRMDDGIFDIKLEELEYIDAKLEKIRNILENIQTPL